MVFFSYILVYVEYRLKKVLMKIGAVDLVERKCIFARVG